MERNRKDRERYQKMASEKKAALIAKKVEYKKTLPAEKMEEYREKRRVPADKRKYDVSENWILHDDARGDINVNPQWNPLLHRLKKKVDAHKSAWAIKCKRIEDWEKAGGLYPSPNIQDKMAITELFIKIMHIKGRRCVQCGNDKMWDFSWRITRKDDFWAMVPFQKKAYEHALRNLELYDVYCLHCAWDISLPTFYWVFGEKSPRNSDKPMHDMYGPRYYNWNKLVQEMYPKGWYELTDKIKRGELKSLSCQIINAKGQKIDSILRRKEFFTWVRLTPRDFHCLVMEEAGQFYMDNFPGIEFRHVGWNNPEEDLSHSRRREPKLMTDDLKRWILATPLGPHRLLTDDGWNIPVPDLPVPEKDLVRKGIYC